MKIFFAEVFATSFFNSFPAPLMIQALTSFISVCDRHENMQLPFGQMQTSCRKELQTISDSRRGQVHRGTGSTGPVWLFFDRPADVPNPHHHVLKVDRDRPGKFSMLRADVISFA